MQQIHRVLGDKRIETLAAHLEQGGGQGLDAARQLAPSELIDAIERSGLRGRGGAGFPTGRKWRTLAALKSATSGEIPIIINAAEGEPGTFKDRALLRTNPYLVIEGAAIAALSVGANEIIIATKATFRDEVERIRSAIAEIEDAKWLPSLRIEVVEGPGEYLFGEETALLEVIDRRPPLPRIAPPFRRGVNEHAYSSGWGTDGRRGDGPGALVDNVETLANVVGILSNGVDWFREIGTPQSPGTIICTVTGAATWHGVAEFAMGTTVRQVITELGGGARPGHAIAAVLNGVSNPPLTPDQFDTPLTYEDMSAIGSGLGSASLIVIDDSTSLLSVAAGVARFLAVESCGQCEPCKRDGLDLASTLATATSSGQPIDNTKVSDRLATVARGARCALAGQTERIVGRLVELALAAGETSSPSTPYLVAPLVEITDQQAVLDTAHLEKRFDWTYPDDGSFSNAWPAQRLANQPVEIKPSRSPESLLTQSESADRPSATHPDAGPFSSLTKLSQRISDEAEALRRSTPDKRQELLHNLRLDIERFRRATERIIYPELERVDPEEGTEVGWYPAHHAQAASRLVHDLDLGATPISPRLIDQLSADIHFSVIEVERRVLPLLERVLREAGADVDTIASGIDELIEP